MPGPFTRAQEEKVFAQLGPEHNVAYQPQSYHPRDYEDWEKVQILKDAIKELEEDMTGPTAAVEFGDGPRFADMPEKSFNGPEPCTTVPLDRDPHMWPTKVEQAPSGLKVTYDLYGKDGETIIRDLSWLQERGVEYTLIWGQSPVVPYNPAPNWIYPQPYKIGDSTPKYPLVTYNGHDTNPIQVLPSSGHVHSVNSAGTVFWPNDTYEENGVVQPLPKDYRANLGAI